MMRSSGHWGGGGHSGISYVAVMESRLGTTEVGTKVVPKLTL